MTYQQCRYKNKVEKIPVRDIHGQSYIFLDDVHDRFPGIQSFTYNGMPIPFEHDKDHDRLKPWRIRANTENIIDCHMPIGKDKFAAGVDNDIQRQLSLLHSDVIKIWENTEILKEKADAILRQTFELTEFTVPRLFIVLPEKTSHFNPDDWFRLNYRLHFLCECENGEGPHFGFHEGYKIKQPSEFLLNYGPYLHKMLTVAKYAISVGNFVAPHLPPNASRLVRSPISKSQIEWLDDILTRLARSEDISTVRNVQYKEGAELRMVETFLKKNDDQGKFGNLFRSVTKDGHVRWVCIQHYEQCYSDRKITDLHEEFQQLGGEIKQDTAIIDEQASSDCSKALSVLLRGLRVCSIILKNLNVKEEDFDALLSYVSQHSTIHSLQIENITVLSAPFNMKKRIIISKLDNTVRANDNLNIHYSFTKPLSTFNSKVIDTIIKTNSRLTFRLRSRESTPSLELVGTNKTGFTLSINNSDEKNDISYYRAISNILSFIPNITQIVLHNGVISESIWTLFFEFLTTNQTLQELTIDCRLTSEQTKELSVNLSDNKMLKALHLFNVWEIEKELDRSQEIFEILFINDTLIEFSLTYQTNQLQLDFVIQYLLLNKSLRVLRLPKCHIHQNIDIEFVEKIFQTTSIDTLSLELISTDCDAFLERLARAIDNNETLETLELKGLDCSAIFHRENQSPDSTDNAVCSSPAQISIRPPRSKFKWFFNCFSCLDGEHRRHSYEEILPPLVVPTQENNNKHITDEPFYALCNHPPFYKQIQEIAQNFKLKELEVTIETHVEMKDVILSMKSNTTVTRLKIVGRLLTAIDIQMLVEALRDNTTITHLNLNEIKISLTYFHQILDVLRDNRILRVLDVSQCVWNSDRNLFVQEVKALGLKNPFLKVVYENP